MKPVVTPVRCVRCFSDRHLTLFETLCTACIFDLAGEANRAYDAVRARHGSPDPKRSQEQLVAHVMLYIESDHQAHEVPWAGCPFCATP